MPTVSVDKANFFKSLGKDYTTQEFDELCFQFGIELDDDTTEECRKAGNGERPQLKIDIPANRYDLLCHEGIARALLVFLGKMKQPDIKVTQPKEMLEIHVDDQVSKIRPTILGAVLRNVTFTPENYASFIDLQDKLHQNLGRRRTLVSMGTHDLDTIKAPFSYKGLAPKDVQFAPLNRPGQVMDGPTLMTTLEQDKHLSKYLSIIRESPVYPVVLDAEETVCSLPPVINGDHSKITLNTKNVLIDMTGTDETRCSHALAELVSMFAEYCGEKFSVEPVKIVHSDGKSLITPDLSPRVATCRLSYINSCTGLDLDVPTTIKLLERMGHSATQSPQSPDVLQVSIPATRPDVLHECDLMEDVAVAYGFDHLPRRFPSTNTVAAPLPINKLSDVLRREFAYAGWVEALSLILCSHDEAYKQLRRPDPGSEAILLENPKSLEYQMVRTTLLPGLLKTLRENRKHSLPWRLFEVSDVARQDAEDLERCAKNERRAVASYSDREAKFEVVHGLLGRVMRVLDVPYLQGGREAASSSSSSAGKKESGHAGRDKGGYWIEESDDPTFMPGRAAVVKFRTPVREQEEKEEAKEQEIKAPATGDDVDAAKRAAPTASATDVEKHLGDADKKQQSSKDSAISAISNLASKLHLGGRKGGEVITVGQLGVLHPEVLAAFGLDWPTAVLELQVEPFL